MPCGKVRTFASADMAARPTPCMGGNRRPGSLRAADLPGQRASDMTAAAGMPNRANRTIRTGRKLDVMCGMNSGCIDLICLDPPLNSKADYAAPVRSKAAGAAFRDRWTPDDVDVAWLDLIEAKRPRLNRFIRAAMTGATKRTLSTWLRACSRCTGCSSRQARSTFTATPRCRVASSWSWTRSSAATISQRDYVEAQFLAQRVGDLRASDRQAAFLPLANQRRRRERSP